MKVNPAIKFKAALLLVVFSMNTILGFACSLGFNMGYNAEHHHKEAKSSLVHQHKEVKKHIHQEGKEKQNRDKHDHHHQNNEKNKDCCSDEVKKFAELDKAIPKGDQPLVKFVFVNDFFAPIYHSSTLQPGAKVDIKQFVRSYHPPIPNIRIAIQSFQI